MPLGGVVKLYRSSYRGGSGEDFQGPNYPGHGDFTGGDYFDYNLEDEDWKTSPYNTWNGSERHFRDLPQSERDVQSATATCNKEEFERAMHRGQDYFSHYNKGYRWEFRWVFWKGKWGHASDGKVPDRDMKAWRDAEKWSKPWVDKWHSKCGCN